MLGLLFVTVAVGTVTSLFLFPDGNLLFGNFALLLVARLYGTIWGVSAALVAGIYTVGLCNTPLPALFLASEAAVTGMLFRRGMRNILLADLIFWAGFGLPLLWMIQRLLLQEETGAVLHNLQASGGIGLANALIAFLLFHFLPFSRWRTESTTSFRERQSNLIAACFLLPSILIVFLHISASLPLPAMAIPFAFQSGQVHSSVGLSIAIMLVPAILAIWLVRTSSRDLVAPLRELVEASDRLPARLREGETVAWPQNASSETFSLLRNIRTMAEELESAYRELESLRKDSSRAADDLLAQRKWEMFATERRLKVETSRRQQVEELFGELEATEAKYRFLLENTLVGVYILQNNHLTYFNPRFAEIFGYAPEEIPADENFLRLVEREDRVLVSGHLRSQSLGESDNLQFRFRGCRKDGQRIHLEALASKGTYRGQSATLGTLMDITDRVQAEATIQHMAYHDPLTGLPNRLLFADRVNQALVAAERSKQGVALLFLDLDRFKTVNDTLGHTVGDQLLKEVSKRLTDCLRETDTIGRFGGDEFNILLPQLKQESDAGLVAHKILRAMKFPYRIEEQELFVTCSIGIALFPRDCQDSASLIKNADTALYQAKDLGRNNYQVYAPAMNARALERMALENSLRRVVERNELRVHYQPQVDMTSGEIVGLEALVRWEHSEGNMIQPSVFIPLAEEIGVIAPIGEWVLRTACMQAKAWQQENFRPLRIGVNVSARQLDAPEFADLITQIVNESGIDPMWINIEITESVVMEDSREAILKICQLHEVGITIAIDDFGIGYSSLGYLKDLPADQLKMDRSFVCNLPHEINDANIAKHIIAMAHEVGLTVIAEGVETQEQYDFLKELGCDEAQGYLFSKPVPAEEFVALLHREEPLPAFPSEACPSSPSRGQ